MTAKKAVFLAARFFWNFESSFDCFMVFESLGDNLKLDSVIWKIHHTC